MNFAGKNSNQAKCDSVVPLQFASVPACSTVLDEKPSSPTHVASIVFVPCFSPEQSADGSTHKPLTSVKVTPEAAKPDQTGSVMDVGVPPAAPPARIAATSSS